MSGAAFCLHYCLCIAFCINSACASPAANLAAATATAQSQPPYTPVVTGSIGGQLGNQLFIVAATLAYAWDYGAVPIFPDFNINSEITRTYKFDVNRDEIFFRLDTSEPPRPFINFYHEPHLWYSALQIPFQMDQRLTGVFQSFDYFHRYRERILDIFAPSAAVTDYLQGKYGELIAHQHTVSVHVRTGDERNHNHGLYFLGLEYFQKAMDLFPEDALFVIFSDRINWCKHHFSAFNKNCLFIEGNSAIQDLFLMSMMKHHIISNSTFSWWGAYLDPFPNTTVVAPTFWVTRKLGHLSPHLFFPAWLRVMADLDAPYPADIRAYDPCSLSIDNQ